MSPLFLRVSAQESVTRLSKTDSRIALHSLNEIAVEISGFLPFHLSGGKIGGRNSIFEMGTCRPLKVIHQTPKVIAAHVKALVNRLFNPLQESGNVLDPTFVVYDPILTDRLGSLTIRTVFGNVDGNLNVVQVVEQMDRVLNRLGIKFSTVIQKVSAH